MVLTHLSKKCSLKLMNLGCNANDVPIITFTFYSVHHVRSYTSTAVGCTPHATYLSCIPLSGGYTQRNLRVCSVSSCLVMLFTLFKPPSPSPHCCLLLSFCSTVLHSTTCGLSASLTVFLLLPFSGSFNITIFNIQWTFLFRFLIF